jgi:ribosomal protein S18 acetylase RimI-like enzyme
VRNLKASDAGKIAYREALPKDLSLLTEIEHRCFNAHDRFKRYQLRRFLSNPSGSVIADVILVEGQPVGWACYFTRANSDLIRLYGMCILPEFGGKGFATAYLKKRIPSFKKYSVMALEVRDENKKAIALYTKLGFTKSRHLHGYYPEGGHGLRMTLGLTPRLRSGSGEK